MVHQLLVVCFMAVIATIVLAESPLGNDIQTIILIGNVDGKSYFVEPEQTMDWFAAKTHCETYGMQLAEITNGVQEDLFNIYNFTPPETRDKYYWLDARESRLPREFTWDRLDTEFKPERLSWYDSWFEEYAFCLLLKLHGTADYGIDDCRDHHHVMCETHSE